MNTKLSLIERNGAYEITIYFLRAEKSKNAGAKQQFIQKYI